MLEDYNGKNIWEGYYVHRDTGTGYHVRKNKSGRFETTFHVHQEGNEGTFVPGPEELIPSKALDLIRIPFPQELINFISTEMDPNSDFSE